MHPAIASAISQVHNAHVPNDPAVPDSCSLTCIKTAILQRGWFEIRGVMHAE
jgi:hypothetical protein